MNLIGHQDIRSRLAAAVKADAVSHAYLFCGKDGIGKRQTARDFAALLTENSAPDIIEVTNERYNVKKTAALSVETIRLARTEMFVRPYRADKKVFIIPDADAMPAGAQNALLKVLEEPPEYCVIILIAENQNSLLPTIRSRAFVIRFAPLRDDEIRLYFADRQVSDEVIRLANGSIGDAEKLLSLPAMEEFLTLTKPLSSPSYRDIYALSAFFEREKEHAAVFFHIFMNLFREMLLKSEKKCDTMNIVRCIDRLESSKTALKRNANYNMVITEFLLSIVAL
jgi:DNA polymerase-3 subunit delta'